MNKIVFDDVSCLVNYVYRLIELNQDTTQKDIWNAITKLATAIDILNIRVQNNEL